MTNGQKKLVKSDVAADVARWTQELKKARDLVVSIELSLADYPLSEALLWMKSNFLLDEWYAEEKLALFGLVQVENAREDQPRFDGVPLSTSMM